MYPKKLLQLVLVGIGLGYALVGAAAAVDYFMPNGQKVRAEIRGNQFILIGMRGPQPAPDGTYRGPDGRSIIVQRGIIVQQGGAAQMPRTGEMKGLNPQPEPPSKPVSPGAAKGFNPQPDPPGKALGLGMQPGASPALNPQPEVPSSKKPVSPGEAKGFNPQPDPPGKQKGFVEQAK
jgi:hypothetical protein